MAKGGQFERDISRDLSLWWTKGERDDLFWRSSQSGGRATSRAKSGRKTFGQYGDISATDPQGRTLLDLMTIELKKGYGKNGTAFDSLDNMPRGKNPIKHCQWEKFIAQAIEDHRKAPTPFWLLLHRRPSRKIMVFVPYHLQRFLPVLRDCQPSAIISPLDFDLVLGTPWEEFKRHVSPRMIRKLHAKLYPLGRVALPERPIVRVGRIVG